MSIALWWKRLPLAALALFYFGLSLLVQIPIIYHAQYYLIVEEVKVLYFVPLGASLVLTTSFVLVTDTLSKQWVKRPTNDFVIILIAILVVVATYYAGYFGVFYIQASMELPEYLSNLRYLTSEHQFIIVTNTVLALQAFFALVINERVQKRLSIILKKGKKK